MRSLLLSVTLAAFICLCGVAGASESLRESPIPPSIDIYSIGPVAMVGHARVPADQVFELWTPVWYETLAKVRNGKMSPAAGDAKLDEEWQRAVLALIKDELFYQEAEREHNSYVNAVVDRIMQQGADRPRTQVANEIRRLMRQEMDKYFRQLNAEMVKESGGMIKLHKVLEGRGLSFQEWQSRLRKKAFTQSYLAQILKPRAPDPGPRQVQEYYATHNQEFAQPGLVQFRHIFFSSGKRGEEQAREDAIAVWEDIMDGVSDFETAVREHSDDEPSKNRGGFEDGEEASDPEREAWLADIRTALREEKPGEVAPILESPFGCHLAVLISVGPERKTPFQEVRRDIERKLQGKVWEQATDQFFQAIRRNTEIRVLMAAFPQHLSCAAQAGLDARSATVYRLGAPDIKTPGRQRGGR